MEPPAPCLPGAAGSAGVRRRTVLRWAACVLLAPAAAACSPAGDATPTPGPTTSPDELLARRVAATAADLAARYDATAAAHPDLAAVLTSLAAHHGSHAAALGAPLAMAGPSATPTASAGPTTGSTTSEPTGTVPTTGPTAGAPTRPIGTATASPTTSPTTSATSPTTGPTSPPVASDPDRALADLAEAEDAAVDEAIDAAVDAQDGRLARLLAGIAASRAVHVDALAAA